MEENKNIQESKPKRPQLLTILCILTFIGSGMGVMGFFTVAVEYEASIKALKVFQGMVTDVACTIGAAFQHVIVKDDEVIIARAPDVDLDHGCAAVEGGVDGVDGVLDVGVGRCIDVRGLAAGSQIICSLSPIGVHAAVGDDVQPVRGWGAGRLTPVEGLVEDKDDHGARGDEQDSLEQWISFRMALLAVVSRRPAGKGLMHSTVARHGVKVTPVPL